MAEHIQEVFWMIDPGTGSLIYVSPAFQAICELPVDAAYSNPKSYRELVHSDDRPRVWQAFTSFENLNSIDEEFRIVCLSGTVKWVSVSASVVRDASKKVVTLVGTVQDITARKLIEVNLRQSEDRYRDLVEHSTDLICTYNLDGRLLSINELPAKLLGYTRHELLDKPMRDFLPAEARAKFEESLLDIQRVGFVKGLMVVLTKSGDRRIWEYHNTLRTDGVDPPIIRGIAHDITEQVRMEKALRVSEEKFSKAFNASPYAMIISTIEEGRLTEVNDSFVRTSGFSREESIGRSFFELGLWTCLSDRDAIIQEIQFSGRVSSRHLVFDGKSGHHLDINYSAEIIEIEGRKCLLSVCEDITKRRKSEARLLEYEKAFEGVEEMIAVIDREYRYLLANEAFAKIRGLTREQVVGQRVADILGAKFFERAVRPRFEEAFRGNIMKYELKNTYPNIGERDMFVSLFPIEGPFGVDRLVCILIDITERKRADEEMRRLSGQLLRLQDEERRKIARDLHDSTGQDLVAVATMLTQLHAAIPSTSRKLRKHISQCRAIANRSLREVRTLSYVLHPPMLDESGLEDAIRDFAEGFAARTGISVHIDVSPRFGRLRQDMEMGLFRIVQESLINIQRHSGSPTATIHLRRDIGKIVLWVRDEGRGISSNERRRSGSTARTCGVGIPSMEERVKQIGGDLEIKSGVSGTSVTVVVSIDD